MAPDTVASERPFRPTVSVIVAVRNGQDTIGDCVESLLQLDYPRGRRELLVVDNASHDATPKILARYRSEASILHESVRGPAAARNAGLRRATGDVVAFTDSDCVVDPLWLCHLVAPLSHPTVGIVGGQNLARRPCSRIAEFGERIHDHRRAIQEIRPPYAITMNWASPRAALHHVGFFHPGLLRCSDVEMAYRMIQAGYRLVYEPNAVIYHKNRSTVGALMWEGYRHGYHAVPVFRLHRQFLSTYHVPPRSVRSTLTAFARRVFHPFLAARRTAATARELPWALLFDLAKSAGRLHGTLASLASPPGAAHRSGKAAR